MRELALFAGAGGGILGGQLLGWRTVCAVERDPYAAGVLVARQNDGCLPPFPIWDDVRTFDGRAWAGRIDVVSGGFPCQDISAAGKGAGIEGARSGLWAEMARIIGEVRAPFAFVENVQALTRRGLGKVLGDLAELGLDAEWGVLGAADAGAPHIRKRLWILAYARELRCDAGRSWESLPGIRAHGEVADASVLGRDRETASQRARAADESRGDEDLRTATVGCHTRRGSWWATEPDVGRVADGVAARVDRLRCLGNGQVPQCAALAWELLMERVRAHGC